MALPEWFLRLERVYTRDDWLDALQDVEGAALDGLLRRNELPESELRSDRIRTVRQALDDDRLTVEDLEEWRDGVEVVIEAVDGINDFRRREPLVNEFGTIHSIPTPTLPAGLGEIRDRLWRGELELETWLAFLDPRREETDRDLFLCRITPEGLEHLKQRLPPATPVDEASADVLDLSPDAPPHVWYPPEPALVAADLDPGRSRLRLRWVGWRRWKGADGTPGERRCVTFARVDLESGDVELQLQHVARGGMRGLLGERERYLRAFARRLGVPAEPVRPEPAMRALMDDDRLELESWRVRLPTGGILSGRRQADLFDKVKEGFDTYYALRLTGTWQPRRDVRLDIGLDARTDVITVREQCDPVLLESLVALVRRHADLAPERPEPAEPAEGEPPPGKRPPEDTPDAGAKIAELRTLIEKLLAYQRRLGRHEVPLDRLASQAATNDLLANAATLKEALDEVGVHYVGATLYVVCPQTGKPVRQGGRELQFERLSDIPPEVVCENERGEPQIHRTEGNIWLRVGHAEPAEPDSFAAIYTSWVGFLVFIALDTWFHAWLRNRFPAAGAVINLGFAASLLAPLAAIIGIYGQDNVEAAAHILRSLAKPLPGAESS